MEGKEIINKLKAIETLSSERRRNEMREKKTKLT